MGTGEMDRRELIQILAAVPMAPALAAGATYTPRFFTAEEYAKLDVLSAALLPDEPGSPGARSANTGYYVDTVLLYAPAEMQQQWRRGVTSIEPGQFAALAAAETNPSNEAERFFGVFKRLVLEAFYQSDAAAKFFGYRGNAVVTGFNACPE